MLDKNEGIRCRASSAPPNRTDIFNEFIDSIISNEPFSVIMAVRVVIRFSIGNLAAIHITVIAQNHISIPAVCAIVRS